ncbi:S24 family peptidase [Sphingobacterium cavernae]|uniref:S24 family peptidase n=1 Tax=Sphingobacterium cavernae TaxID=2592657 RepID=UPI001CB7B3B6|nr:S24/S26 family peptidase [Sphingobacterium cavernae]
MEYIHFLYNENIDINSIYDDSTQISYRNSSHTPIVAQDNSVDFNTKNTPSVHPSNKEIVHPTVHPTTILGLPKVITIGENDAELISLVPVKAAAGYLNGYGDPEYVETLPTIRMPNLGNGTHRAFEIKGHSMSPTMHNSSISIGRWTESLNDIRDGRIYIIVTKSEGIVVKRVLNRSNDSGKLILISDNHNKREYPNIILDASDVIELWYQRANLAFEFPEPDTMNTRVNDLEARLSLFEYKIKHLLK